jgi:hypothetical protein
MAYDKSRDPYRTLSADPRSNFGRKGRINVKHDTNDLNPYAKAITVLTAGTLKILPVGNADGDTVSYAEVPVGFSPPYQIRRVFSTGSTATVATVED